jgi:hypothetical protein
VSAGSSSLSLPAMLMMAVSGKSRLLSAGFHARTDVGVELSKEVFTSRAR